MNKQCLIIIFFICFSYADLLTGLDVFEQKEFDILYDKNIGLVINHTSLNNEGIHILDLLSNYNNIHIQSIFTPEHGLKGNISAGEEILDTFNKELGVKIVSLYGDQKEPELSDIANLDYIANIRCNIFC